MTEHTPTPWRVTRKYEVGPISVADDQSCGMVIPVADVFGDNRENDATFIVKAVNAHDELVKALEQIEYASRKDSLTEHERLQSVRTVVCAALSRFNRPFYGAECPSYPACNGGCGLGCTKEIERSKAPVGGASRQGERS